jgi:segregation and condensation protein A
MMEQPPDKTTPPVTEPDASGGATAPSVSGLPPTEMDQARHRLRVQLESFQGPLDLLLHLVRINEVDIQDIPVVEIAQQYNAYLDTMRELDLDIAGEFLVMAATLAYIKSRMLLPRPQGEDGEEEDPRADLAERLLEHQRFLIAAEELSARSDVQDSVWSRPAQRVDMDGEILLEVSVHDLVRSFRGLLESIGVRSGMEIEPEGLSVNDRMGQILDLVDSKDLVAFEVLFPEVAAKRDRIVTFLALLELLRLQMVSIWQSQTFGAIRLSRAAARPGGPRPIQDLTP